MEQWVSATAPAANGRTKRARSSPETRQPDLKDLVVATARLSVASARRLRVHEGQISCFALLKADSELAKHLLSRLETFKQTIRGDWSPHMWAALVLFVVRAGDYPPDTAILKEHAATCSSADMIRPLIVECEVHLAFDKQNLCLTTTVKPDLYAIQSAMFRCLDKLGADIRFGAAPPRSLERQVASALRLIDR
jgi:hypothetical protein